MQRYPLFPESEETCRIFHGDDGGYLPKIREKAHLVFADAPEGKIRIGCHFSDHHDGCKINPRFETTFDLGLIPDEVANQGTSAIRLYAKQQANALIGKERQRLSERDQRIANLNERFEIRNGGFTIRGFVKKDRDEGPRANFMKLTMTEPFQLETLVFVSPQCWASAVNGTRTFDEDGRLLDQEIQRLRSTLITMCDRETHKRNKPPSHHALAALKSESEGEVADDDEYIRGTWPVDH